MGQPLFGRLDLRRQLCLRMALISRMVRRPSAGEPGGRAQFVEVDVKILAAAQPADDLFQQLVLGLFLDQIDLALCRPCPRGSSGSGT